MKKFKKFIVENILYLAWIQALVATAVSLYASEVLKLPPCVLCWYQRIFMYPLAIILPIGIFNKDKKIHQYVLPLSIFGMLVALYHYLLQIGVIPENLAPCISGISCTTKYTFFNSDFITIPLLSFLAFALITLCMMVYKHFNNNKK